MILPEFRRYYPLGDQAIVLCLGDVISENINTLIRKVSAHIDDWCQEGIIEYVPAYTTITIYYDPLKIDYQEIQVALEHFLTNISDYTIISSTKKEIPVYYHGPDLSYVAQYNKLSEQEVIAIHSGKVYLVYMIGFAPGFPYLGGMDARISTPRKEVPRLKIEAGSVGIAGEQTGVYPIETPGGWQIIGQTPLQLFDNNRDKPSLLEVGDRVCFVPIGDEEFLQLKAKNYGY